MLTVLKFLVGLAVPLGCLIMGLNGLNQIYQFTGDGVVRVTGTVEWLHDGGRRLNRHDVSYRYTDKAGTTYSTLESVDDATDVRLWKGSPISIKYLASSPATSRIDLPAVENYQWVQSRNITIIGAIVLALVILVGLAQLRRA